MNAQPDTVQLEYRTLQEIITEKLRDAILRGELQPGEKLVQDELARRFGVSRMPIREAFRTLEGEGLVTFHPHRGVVVTELSVEEIEEVFAVMNMTEEVADELRQLLAQSEAAQDEPDRYLDLNSVFHYTFFNAAQRPRLVALIRDLRNTVQPYLRLHLTAKGRLQGSLAEHWAIYEACIAGDAEETESLAQAHLQESLEALLASLRAEEEKDTK
jgi:DNA-binding GntR family transcriptional regulator